MALALGAGAFMVGSIPFSFLFVRGRTGQDLRLVGSGNPGATNAWRAAGPAAGLLGLVLDVGKGFVPTWLVRQLGLGELALAAVAVACVAGHVFSPWLGFRGGKGVATGLGAVAAIHPIAVLVVVPIFLVTVSLTRIVSLGSIVATASLPVVCRLVGWSGEHGGDGLTVWLGVVAICLIILWRHRDNFRRLRAGSEAKLGRRPT